MSWQLNSTQNGDGFDFLAARSANFRWASRLYLVSFIAPLGLSFIGFWMTGIPSDAANILAIVSLFYTFLELVFIERTIARATKVGAGLAEKFDCEIFGIPRNEYMKGELSVASISHATESMTPKQIDALKNWYNPELQKLPKDVAAVAAQYTSTAYDMALRKTFVKCLFFMLGTLILGVLAFMIYKNLDIRQSLVTSVIPFLPLAVFLIKNALATRDLIAEQEAALRVMDTQIKQILRGVLRGGPLLEACRDNQDALYMRRSAPLLVMPGIYLVARRRREESANRYAAKLVSEYLAKHPA